jgi:hypothetical protein
MAATSRDDVTLDGQMEEATATDSHDSSGEDTTIRSIRLRSGAKRPLLTTHKGCGKGASCK